MLKTGAIYKVSSPVLFDNEKPKFCSKTGFYSSKTFRQQKGLEPRTRILILESKYISLLNEHYVCPISLLMIKFLSLDAKMVGWMFLEAKDILFSFIELDLQEPLKENQQNKPL